MGRFEQAALLERFVVCIPRMSSAKSSGKTEICGSSWAIREQYQKQVKIETKDKTGTLEVEGLLEALR